MFEDGWDPVGEPAVVDGCVSADDVAAWAAGAPANEAIFTPFGVLDPAQLSDRGRIDALTALERLRCWVDYQQQLLLAAVQADDTSGAELASCEVACLLKIPAGYAQAKLHTAATLVDRLPATLDLLRVGSISPVHARVLAEASFGLDARTTSDIEAAVLGRAPGQTVGALRRSIERAKHRLAPADAEQRHADAVAERCVRSRPLPDGMGQLSTVLTGDDLAAVTDVLNTEAKRLAAAGDDRTPDQLRADTLVDRILGRTDRPTGTSSGAHVQVTVALSTLTGLDDQPGELAGYGPIPASMARRLAAQPDSTWRRLVTDVHGRLLDYGRTTYRPPAALADFVRAWDQRCVFPTCNRRAKDCDLDRLLAWREHGDTNFDNLATECPRHHHVKHDADWAVQRLPDGTIRWTSPTGHTYDRPLDPLPIDRTANLLSDPDPPPF